MEATTATAAKTNAAPKPGTARWLSAAGHPGYGRRYAADVLAVIRDHNDNEHDLRAVSAYAFRVIRGYHDEFLVSAGRDPYTHGFALDGDRRNV